MGFLSGRSSIIHYSGPFVSPSYLLASLDPKPFFSITTTTEQTISPSNVTDKPLQIIPPNTNHHPQSNPQESYAARADMAALEFDDRHTQIAAENEPYHQYEDQAQHAENGSWAGALPVKQ